MPAATSKNGCVPFRSGTHRSSSGTGSIGRASARTPWGASVRAWESSRARGTVSTGMRIRPASSSMRSSRGEGSWSSANMILRTVRRPTVQQFEDGLTPLDLVTAELALLGAAGAGPAARTTGTTPSPPPVPPAPPPAPLPRAPVGRRAVATAGRRHVDSNKTMARQAMPSARPSAPKPSARVAFTDTGAAQDSGERGSPSSRCGGPAGGRRRSRCSRRWHRVALFRGHPHDLGQEGHAVGPLPDRVGVGEVASEVPESHGAEHRVGQGMADGIGVTVATEATSPSMTHASEHQGRCGSSENRWMSIPCPMRMLTALLNDPVGGAQVVGRGDLEVARLARHHPDGSAELLDQGGVVGGVGPCVWARRNTAAPNAWGVCTATSVGAVKRVDHVGVGIHFLDGVAHRHAGNGRVGAARC